MHPPPISDMLLAKLKREGRKVIIAVLADSGIVDGTGAIVSIKSQSGFIFSLFVNTKIRLKMLEKDKIVLVLKYRTDFA
jgi:hypothetical protein